MTKPKPKPKSAYQIIRLELGKAARKGCHEVTVDDLSYLTDREGCEVRMLARIAMIDLGIHEQIFYFRRWGQNEKRRPFIRAYKANDGSDMDKAETNFDLEHDRLQLEGRNQVLTNRADCAQENKILSPYGAKRYKYLPMGKSRLLGSPEDKSKKLKKTS